MRRADSLVGNLGVLAGSALLAVACAQPGPMAHDHAKFYARNAELDVNGAKGRGTLVVGRAPKYQIKLTSQADMDFLLIRSCAREVTAEKRGREFSYVYEPAPGLEDVRSCPVSFIGVEKGANRRTVGWLSFHDPRRQLPATLKCNGRVTPSPSVSACESGAGLLQRIEFTQPVAVVADRPECEIAGVGDGYEYTFTIRRGACSYLFTERAGQGRSHWLETYGFDETAPMESR